MANNNDPDNITAEWTVHAQLTITRPGDKVKNSNDQKDSSDDVPGNDRKQSNPVTVVYKWSSDDMKKESTKDKNSFSKANVAFKSERKSDTNDKV